ncbi:MAG: formylglycine-generating enzyme family protein [Azoarcus sp.]|jgi:formylglycine-generating enzyme required for sulfatase activity|nr:formylglycine-generating enzyme family protein [Azoarcus sp.]
MHHGFIGHCATLAAPALTALLLVACKTPPPSETVNSLGMEFVLIQPGSFEMGCGGGDPLCLPDEKPQHRVTIRRPFYLGRHEVTQEQWRALTGNEPGAFRGDRHPVENVSWREAQEFIRRLNAREGTRKYRLPTEAEWEYAARAGTVTRYSFDPSHAAEYVWYWNDSGNATHPVGEKRPNPWGLYDMHGNVWEWVWDWHGEDAYARGEATDPKGPPDGTGRALRGGSWSNDLRYLRASHRNVHLPDYKHATAGFRVVYLLDEPQAEEEAKPPETAGARPPGREKPELEAPEITPPEVKLPEVKLPEIKAPEIKLPKLPW